MPGGTENGRALARLEANQKHILDALKKVNAGIADNAENIVSIKVALASSATWTAGHEQQHVSEAKAHSAQHESESHQLKRWLGLGSMLSAIIGSAIGVFADR